MVARRIRIGTSGATWDESNKNANITLSGGNLHIYTPTGTFEYCAVRATASQSTGKYYSEHTIDFDNAFAPFMGIGIADGLRNLNDSFSGTAGGRSCGMIGDGSVLISESGSAVDTFSPFAEGDVVKMAVDLDNDAIWWKVNAGDWNDDPSADPATNTGGYALDANLIAAKPLFPMMHHAIFTGVIADQESTSDFSGTGAPGGGFGPW